MLFQNLPHINHFSGGRFLLLALCQLNESRVDNFSKIYFKMTFFIFPSVNRVFSCLKLC